MILCFLLKLYFSLETTRPSAMTTTPCYSIDVMQRDDIVLSIKELDTNTDIPISSIRTGGTGVTFPSTRQPKLFVELSYTLISQIISIGVPNVNGVTNVDQIEITFYGTNGQIIRNPMGEDWTVETIPGVTKV